jgi:aminoglycoside phosphotransferase (APT) family kinase protein
MDEVALAAYLEDKLAGTGPIKVERHQAGHSNETFFLTRGEERFVLRRPPAGAFLPSAHDVGREYKVLTALNDSDVRTPRTFLYCEDESVIGAPFYVMERVDGYVIRDSLPPEISDESAIGPELVDALVELHAITPPEGLGRPERAGSPGRQGDGYLDRQLRRWKGQLELTLPFTRPLPQLEQAGEWLHENKPESPAATLVHGDYKLDNVMFSPPGKLVTILDWEMSTIGDPLADLGWMVSFWREPGSEDGLLVESWGGKQMRDELVDRYAEKTGRDVSGLKWYQVLAVWKLAILLEGSYARHLAGVTDDPFFARLETGVPDLARIALRVAASS